MDTNTVKGFRDFIGDEARKRAKIKKIIACAFESFGFEPAETPVVEMEEFVRGDNQNDEAVRDIFSLEDRGKRKLALRYELTFQLKRIAQNQKLPYKRYQLDSVFRDEPIRKGRLRQFVQCDIDTIGSSVNDEAETLSVTKKVFEKLKIPIKLFVNNRKLIDEILETENIKEMDREQVIRELDKLGKLTKKEVADNLKKLNAEKLLKIFTQEEKGFEKYGSYKEIKELKKLCREYGTEIIFQPTLARGLSYYNGSVFEAWSDELNVSLAGGGSYLVGSTQSTGISFGLEPIFLLAKTEPDYVDYLLISLDQNKKTIRLADLLRNADNSVQVLLDKTLKKAMEYANVKKVKKVIVIGGNEVKAKKYKVKDMSSGEEKEMSEKELLS
jgi:histidyl-tRNA synthetase